MQWLNLSVAPKLLRISYTYNLLKSNFDFICVTSSLAFSKQEIKRRTVSKKSVLSVVKDYIMIVSSDISDHERSFISLVLKEHKTLTETYQPEIDLDILKYYTMDKEFRSIKI